MIKLFGLFAASFLLIGCTERLKEIVKDTNEIGETDIRYYADKTVTSLEVPPDLTKPKIKDRVNLKGVVDTSRSLVTFDDSTTGKPIRKVRGEAINIEVQRNKFQSYLVVDKDANFVFNAVKSFLKEKGFSIENEVTELGLLETNFLENRTKLPKTVLNPIRALFQDTLGAQYSLPTVDKYRARIESITPSQTEVYLSLNSMQEVLTNEGTSSENTIWQVKPRDEFTENQMLYLLMIHMGTDSSEAKQKVANTIEQRILQVEKKTDINGFAKLQLNTNKEEAWEALAFAIDSLGIDIQDRDRREGSFYISIANDEERGIFSSIFGDDAILQSFRIRVKQIQPNFSEVYFIDLSGENNKSTQKFSHTLLERIADAL